jgi:hypothetical protein
MKFIQRRPLSLSLLLMAGVLFALPCERGAQGQSADSLIAPWLAKDIGKPAVPGAVRLNPAQYWVVQAANGDIGTLPKKLDEFFFIYQPLTGDGSILALIHGLEGGSPQWSKAGVMLREGLTPGSRNAFLGMATGPGPMLSVRAVPNKSTVVVGTGSRYGARRFPVWLRLQREGNEFTPFSSADGFGWTQLNAPVPLPRFGPAALAGLATSSFREGMTTAVYGNALVAPGLLSPLVRVASGTNRVLLFWPPVSGAAGYVVRRSRPQSPGFAGDVLTPEPIRETSFLDSGVPNGQVTRYLVSALFDGSEGRIEGWPTAVPAQPVALPGDLAGCDINLESTLLRGSIEYDQAAASYKISGSGGDVGGNADRCYFASRWLSGDFQITVRMDGPSSRIGAKAGLMVRESLEGPARMVFLSRATGEGVQFQTRRDTGGNARDGKPLIAEKRIRTALYLRLARQNGAITPFVSTDGVQFNRVASAQTLGSTLPEGLHVGYAITAGAPAGVATQTFTQLTINAGP